MPAMLAPDSDLIAELERFHQPTQLDVGESMPPATMVFPLRRRSEVFGLLLVGAKSGGEAFRPDEPDNLAQAAQQLSLDLSALRVEQLERRSRDFAQEVAGLREQLQSLSELHPK
jgi:hypothetical protein